MDTSLFATRPVVFFDSGVGGLTLLKECAHRLPSNNFVYFADNKNMPYGELPQEKILKLADEKFSQMSLLDPIAAVIACNTVTARCAAFLRQKYSFPIVGIQPAVKPAAAAGGHCVVLATPATAESAAVRELVQSYGHGKTKVIACPKLADYIERNILDLCTEEINALLPQVRADSVVLGCTHYILIEEQIKKFYGCNVYDGLEGTARRLCTVLNNSTQAGKTQGRVLFSGGDAEKNRRVYELLLKGAL